MKIGILSDTHGDIVQTKKVLKILQDCEYIIHCGDVLYHGPRNDLPKNYNPRDLATYLSKLENIYYIRGNCDSDVDEMVIKKDLKSKSRVFNFGKYTIFAIHGYEETEEKRIEKAREFNANIVVSGHTHVKVLKKIDNIIVINPGSTTIPKDGTSSCAIINNKTIDLINIEDNSIIDSLII
ncbi:phosphodiesterase [Miniphocaeibacter halophilus]|uniref:Phosphodiesterase n=1 Tax=Miniphocaeibacter halophilus TaxID=2931922 RepID=A0AC61MYX7_9FIRM|nr:phosphodiesterase [Miniphocaeibacter halophilus]QQK07463.1 phosphodiesterase [Miniphocaeibacter halophilus]